MAEARVYSLPMRALWTLSRIDMHEAVSIAIAVETRQVVAQLGRVGSRVLGQASMAVAADLLLNLEVAVLASPEFARRATLR